MQSAPRPQTSSAACSSCRHRLRVRETMVCIKKDRNATQTRGVSRNFSRRTQPHRECAIAVTVTSVQAPDSLGTEGWVGGLLFLRRQGWRSSLPSVNLPAIVTPRRVGAHPDQDASGRAWGKTSEARSDVARRPHARDAGDHKQGLVIASF